MPEARFEKEELKQAIFPMHKDQSLSKDGFNVGFFTKILEHRGKGGNNFDFGVA